jgi:urease beta subunit
LPADDFCIWQRALPPCRQLAMGDRYKIPPGTAHRISNQSASECQFVLVQGVGRYDWQKAGLTKNEKTSSH